MAFWKDEESSQIVNLEKGSKHTYESDLLSNTDTKSNSNCSEYLPTSDNESITSETSVRSETSSMFPPLIKIHPKTYHIKKIILTKTGSMMKFDDNNDDIETLEDNDENLENDDEIYDGDNENGNSDNDDIYNLSSPLYDSDSNDRFEKLKFLWKLQNQNNDDNDTDENYLNNDDKTTANDDVDKITVEEIRAQLNDTSDEDI